MEQPTGQSGGSTAQTLVSEQSRKLLEVNAHIADTITLVQTPEKIIGLVADIIGTKIALVGKDSGTWAVLAEAGPGPAVPGLGNGVTLTLDRVGDATTVVLELWRHQSGVWTLIGLTRRAGTPAVLMLAWDWMRSEATLLQLGHNLLLADCAYALAASAHVRLAGHPIVASFEPGGWPLTG